MKVSNVSILCAVALAQIGAALPQATRKPLFDPLPAGSKDGLHIGTLNEDGTTHWEYHGETLVNRTSEAVKREPTVPHTKRAYNGAHCVSYSYDQYDWQLATQGLEQQCGSGTPYSNVISYQSGITVAYGCNYGNGQVCVGTEIEGLYSQFSSACGDGWYGWWEQGDWAASYGVTDTTTGFC